MAPKVDVNVVRSVVQDHLKKHGDDGTLTARVVRVQTEQRMGLADGALMEHKEALMKAIEQVIGEQPKPAASDGGGDSQQAQGASVATDAQCAAARAAVEADAEAAESLLREAEAASEVKAAAALLEQVEAAAHSRVAAERLVAAGLARRLAPRLAPGADRSLAALAVRALTAASLHEGLTAALLKAPELVPAMLAALVAATESVAIPLVDLLHNLADSDANRLRLTAAGCLPAVTRLLLEPTGSATLKEHALNAAASLAGVPETELSFPEIVTRCCAHRIPGVQKEGVKAMALLAARDELRGRLAGVPGLPKAMRAAAKARDAECAQQAAEILAALKLPAA